MVKKINLRTKKINGNFISECKVLNEDDGKFYYVVARFGDLLYATVDASMMDYMLGVSDKEPNIVEGNTYFWYNRSRDTGETAYWQFYIETYDAASEASYKDRIHRKYAHRKKPNNNFKYEVVYKKSECYPGCGPCDEVYEICFHLPDENRNLYVSADDFMSCYSLTDYSVIDENAEDFENREYRDPIEFYESLDDIKKSYYYDLFLELEKYRDGVES